MILSSAATSACACQPFHLCLEQHIDSSFQHQAPAICHLRQLRLFQRQRQWRRRCSFSYNFSNVRELRQHPFGNARQTRSKSIFFSTYSATSCDMHPGITLLLHQNSDISDICDVTQPCAISATSATRHCVLCDICDGNQRRRFLLFLISAAATEKPVCIAAAAALSACFPDSNSAHVIL